MTETSDKANAIRCDACPVLCYINPGRTGACDRYANDNGKLIRIDPHVVLDRAVSRGDSVVPFLDRDREWDGSIVTGPENFVTLPISDSFTVKVTDMLSVAIVTAAVVSALWFHVPFPQLYRPKLCDAWSSSKRYSAPNVSPVDPF